MRSDEEVWTPLKLVDWTEKHFARNSIDQPRLEAEFLLAHVLGWERIDLYTRFEHTVEPQALSRFRQLLKRRAQRVPRQYLTGDDEFYGLTLTVDERVLIPRNETEHLVEQTLELLDESAEATVVDLCTGSGAVAVAVAANRDSVRVLACDVSADALEVARINVDALNLAERVELHRGDLFDAAPAALRGTIDIVVANPPYVREDELETLVPEVALYEPREALVAGPTGLEIIERIITDAPDWLKPDGHLLLEIGYGQSEAVCQLASATNAFGPPRRVRDYAKIERVIILKRERNHG